MLSFLQILFSRRETTSSFTVRGDHLKNYCSLSRFTEFSCFSRTISYYHEGQD